eukprot:scaffold1132_cov347-Pavlova_lutheri.AAC.9
MGAWSVQDVRLFFCPTFSWMARCSGRMVSAEEDRWKGRLNGSFTIHTDRSRLGLGSSSSNTSIRVGRAMDVHVDPLHRLVELDPRKTCLPHRPTTMGHPAPTPHPPLHPRDPRGAGRGGGNDASDVAASGTSDASPSGFGGIVELEEMANEVAVDTYTSLSERWSERHAGPGDDAVVDGDRPCHQQRHQVRGPAPGTWRSRRWERCAAKQRSGEDCGRRSSRTR